MVGVTLAPSTDSLVLLLSTGVLPSTIVTWMLVSGETFAAPMAGVTDLIKAVAPANAARYVLIAFGSLESLIRCFVRSGSTVNHSQAEPLVPCSHTVRNG